MIVKFPLNKIWRQINQGELFGDLWGSWNLDLTSNKGKIRVSPQTSLIMSTNDDANFKYPVAFKRTSADGADKAWILANTKLYKLAWSSFPGVLTADAISNTPTVSHLTDDMDEFNSNLIVSVGTDLSKLSGGTWTANWWTGAGNLNQAALGSNPHPTHTAFNNLFVFGDGNKIHTIDTSNNVDTGGSGGARLTLKAELQVVWIRSSRTTIWIGCRNTKGRPAEIIQWDGGSPSFNNNFKLNTSECYCGIIKDDIPYAISGNGEFLQFNGRGFTVVDNFPIFKQNKDHAWSDQYTIPNLVHRNGMAIIDGNINTLINAAIDGSNTKNLDNMHSGIWEYTKDTGLYHKFSITKPATSKTDFGSPVLVKPGFLVEFTGSIKKFIAGAELYTQDGGTTLTETGVIVNVEPDSVAKIGYLITPQIYTEQIQEVWQTFWLLSPIFLNATTKVITKYRLSVKMYDTSNFFDEGQPAGSWASTTTFTYDTISYPDALTVSVGDEVQILSGIGAGLCAKITTISDSGSTRTFTIDQTCTGASGNITVTFDAWVQIDSWQDLVMKYRQININQMSSFIQFKIVMFGLKTSPEIEKIRLRSDSNKQI